MYYINKFLALIARNVKKVIVFAVVLVGIALCTIMAYDFAYDFVSGDPNEAYDPNGETVMLTIPAGATSKEIAALLEEKGIVSSARHFSWRAKLLGKENDFKFGTYAFVKGMPEEMIMDMLRDGSKQESVRITIPEGWTIDQIAEYLQEKEICLKEDFLAACEDTSYDFDYYTKKMKKGTAGRRHMLEGYLFPDTYDVIPEDGAVSVVKRLLRQFEVEWSEDDLERIDELGLTMDKVVIMASVIEKEAKLDEERPMMAAVLYNRMEQDMPWQLNSTVLYALGIESGGEDNLTYDDLEIDSGYNTYKYAGYPIGPICNPGYSSLQAVLYPADTDAIYFVLKEDGSGSHFFTNDYDEFLAAADGNYPDDDDYYESDEDY
ncbi:MAG: endolytic transglycosylase MltG [Firmicutes bacterium]|nr:endolytic transglycosylase MltG [Bacillota bacterium]